MYKNTISTIDAPIQYKTIRPEDFDGYNTSYDNFTIIVQDENGYISDFLASNIDLSSKDTTVINASVGQGKTTALLDIVKKYYEESDYLIFLVAPFKSLLNQYYDSLLERDIPFTDILDYRVLDDENYDYEGFKAEKRRIQLFTFNFIMANPGEFFLKQSYIKVQFIDELLKKCKDEGKKVIMIFDEVHDSIDNFKEELVFNLFRWRKYVQKVFVSSATYNEASKVVIKYFAELTDRKIQILESPREQNETRLSELNVMIYDHNSYDIENQNLKDLFDIEIGKASTINVLTYSKFLTEKLRTSHIGNKIRKKYGEINICTGDTDNIFDDSKCNMGTNFKTGISIKQKNAAFFIFLPQKNSYVKLPKKLGIFTDGINSLIQALARPREKARIYVISPMPTDVIIAPENNENKIPKSNHYISINKQDKLLKLFYDKTKSKLWEEIGYFQERNTLIKAQFPNYDQYKLTQGEQYFRTYFDIFGKNISNYFYWATINNQFINCKLKYVYRLDLEILEDNMLESILSYFNLAFNETEMFRYLSPVEQYRLLRESIFSNNVSLKKKDNTITPLKPYGKIEFEKNIIKFIQQYNSHKPYLEEYLGFNYINYMDDIINHEKTMEELEPHKRIELLNYLNYRQKDYLISTEEYIRSAIYFAKNNTLKSSSLSKEETSLIYLYTQLDNFKDKLLRDYLTNQIKGKVLLPIDNDFKFTVDDFGFLEDLFNKLKENDPILKNVFNVLQGKATDKNIYSLLKKIYFESDRASLESGKVKQPYIKRDITNDEHGKMNFTYKQIDFVSLVNSYENEYKQEYLDAIEEE